MTEPICLRWHGELAMRSLGKLEPEIAVGLQAHLDGCAECRTEAVDLLGVADALDAASPEVINDPTADQFPSHLQETVLRQLETEVTQEHRRRARRRTGVFATVAAVAAGIALAAVLVVSSGSPAPTGRMVALSGTPGTTASITLLASASGTNVTLHEHGQPVGRDFVVTMQSTSGTWWQAGSYHTSGATVRAQLTCAAEPYEITKVWVQDSTGTTVLSGYAH